MPYCDYCKRNVEGEVKLLALFGGAAAHKCEYCRPDINRSRNLVYGSEPMATRQTYFLAKLLDEHQLHIITSDPAIDIKTADINVTTEILSLFHGDRRIRIVGYDIWQALGGSMRMGLPMFGKVMDYLVETGVLRSVHYEQGHADTYYLLGRD